jgi:NAD(P)-dependent dehydrogenase (short-subunit alcohol dehydrogenase family)
MPPKPSFGPMDVVCVIGATAIGGWLLGSVKGHAAVSTAIFGTTTAILYLLAPARKFPTAEQVASGTDLTGQVALVTGATSGIGVETARVLALQGARVYLAGRSPSKLQAVLQDVQKNLPEDKATLVSTLECDLNDLDSVRRGAREFLKEQSKLHLLVTNAGVMALPQRQATAQGLEQQVGICHVGHFYLAQLLLPALQAAGKDKSGARVVALSSSAHSYHEISKCIADPKLDTVPYDPWTAYGNAKCANLLFAKGVNDRFAASHNIHAFSVMPGGIFTGLQGHVGWHSRLNYFFISPFFFKTIPQGAATTVYCATAPLDQLAPGEYHDDCTPKPAALQKVLEYASDRPNVVDDLWTATERLIKSLGFA